jgi:Cdc6-like AAA superfamily ATPase
MRMLPQPFMDNPKPDKLDTFTDREHFLDQFQRSLHSAQPGQFHLLAVKGNSGTGKTFLIEYLTRRVCPSFEWQTGQLTFYSVDT